jgi:hypothetical protein
MVYVGSLPLRAPPGIAQQALSLAESLSPPSPAAPRHFYTILASSCDDADSVKHKFCPWIACFALLCFALLCFALLCFALPRSNGNHPLQSMEKRELP